MLSVGSEAIPRQTQTASVSLSWVMLHLSLLESTHSIKIKGKTISWLMFASFDRFLSRLSGVTSPSGSTLSFSNHFLIRGQSHPFSVPHFVLGMPGLLRGLGQGKHSLPRVFAARNGEGKQGEYLEAVLSHAVVCFLLLLALLLHKTTPGWGGLTALPWLGGGGTNGTGNALRRRRTP